MLFRKFRERWIKIAAAVAGVIIVVLPVVSLGSFEPTKACHTGLFCKSVWITGDGFNYGMLAFLVVATILIVLLVIAEFSATQQRPVTAWTKYANDIAVWMAETLGPLKIERIDLPVYYSTAKRILHTMAAVAGSVSSEEPSVRVDASLMVAKYPAPAIANDAIHFLHHGRHLGSYPGALSVDAYSQDVALPHIILPVDKGPHVLPGAPAACDRRKPVVIDDTLHIDWENHRGIDDELRGRVEEYFEKNKDVMRTVLCIPVKQGDTVLGVVNISSPTPRLFEGSAELVSKVLAPYITLVLALLDHRHKQNYPFVQV
jgi:hypothetical protein